MDFHTLSRRQLQTLCKKNKIPANQTNVAMAAALAALPTVEGLDEISPSKGGESACVTATTARRANRAPIGKTPAKVKALDFTEETEAVPNQTPAPVPASRRRGAGVKGGETALMSVRRSTRLAAKSASRGSEATAPKKMEFEEIVESFGEISLDEKPEEKSEVIPVKESDISAEIVDANNVTVVVDETKIDEPDTITVDALAERDVHMSAEVVESKVDEVSEIEARNDEVLDGTAEHVINEKAAEVDDATEEQVTNDEEVHSIENVQMKEKAAEVDDATEEQVTDEEEVHSIGNVQMKEPNVEAMEDVEVNASEKAVEKISIDISGYQIETSNSEVVDANEEQVIFVDEKVISSSDFGSVSENVEDEVSNVKVIMNVDESSVSARKDELDVLTESGDSEDTTEELDEDAAITETVVETVMHAGSGIIPPASADVLEDGKEDQSSEFESEGSNVEDSDVDDQSSDYISEEESEAESDDLSESGDSEDDSSTETVEEEMVVALEAPSAAAEVSEENLAEKLNSIELKDDVVEEHTAMENKPKEDEGLNNTATAMEMNVEKSEAAITYLSPVKADASQFQMSVSKTPTSGKRMSLRFSDDNDKENSMIDSIGAKMMMLTSEKKESVQGSQKASYKADEISLRKLRKEIKAKLSEQMGNPRPALQALPENNQVMESN